jgi:glycosyltransferase involved in cell wall biosynthesis
MIKTPELSIVVPVKDEQEAVAPFVARLGEVLAALDDPAGQSYEILFIDDGSHDATLLAIRAAIGRDPRVRALSLSRNFGKEAALSAGIDHARGAAVVPMDVDLQDPPEALGDMVREWRAGFDIVYGVRDDRQTDSLPKRLSADLYYRAHNFLSQDKIPEHAGDFRLLDRKVVDVIRAMPERNRFMKGLFAWAGFTSTSVHYRRAARAVGTTKFATGSCGPWRSTESRRLRPFRCECGAISGAAWRSLPWLMRCSSSSAPCSTALMCQDTHHC